jgi:serine/threonine-protein kinase
VQVIAMAHRGNVLEFQIDYFLSKFIESGPTNDREVEAFYQLATLYRRHGHAESATGALRKLVRFSPGFRDAEKLLGSMDTKDGRPEVSVQKIAEEDAAFRHAGDKSTAVLPDLPPLEALGSMVKSPTPRSELSSAHTMASGHVPPGTFGGHGSQTSPLASDRTGAVGPRSSAVSTPEPSFGALLAGTTILNRYELVREIGRGGMAAVFEARDLELGERIALKFLMGGSGSDEVERFRRELSLTRRLNHPNVLQVFDIGLFGTIRFISMEILEGTDLAKRLKVRIPVLDGLDYLIQACQGLGAAHDRGIIHRDVKPANFFVTKEGVLKVMDFGIAKGQHTPGITQSGFMAGTPDYVAPEQIRGFGSVDHRADIYALGVTAYEIFAGRKPFFHEQMMPLLMMHINDAPDAPRKHNPEIPVELEALILRLMEKNPDKRPSTCHEVARWLSGVRNLVSSD